MKKGTPPKQGRTEMVAARITRAQREWLEGTSREQDIPIAAVIRSAIYYYMRATDRVSAKPLPYSATFSSGVGMVRPDSTTITTRVRTKKPKKEAP